VNITPSQETQEQLKALGYISQSDEANVTPPSKDCVSCKPAPSKNQQ
jgi:hypothetical protein